MDLVFFSNPFRATKVASSVSETASWLTDNMFGYNMGTMCLLQRAASPTFIQEQKQLQER